MKINMINGSQKVGESNSGIVLNKLNGYIKEKYDVKIFNLGIKSFSEETLKEILAGDAIVLAFPLFCHSIPSNMLNMLIELEAVAKKEQTKGLIVYTIINNGFYEGNQNYIGFEIIQNFCERAGLKFGGGIGQGAGEMIGATKNIPLNKGPFYNLAIALKAMIKKISTKEHFGIVYLSPKFPRFLWKIMAVKFWHNLAKENGINKKEILNRL